MKKKITSISQIEGGTNPTPKAGMGHYRPEFKLGGNPGATGIMRADQVARTKTPLSRVTQEAYNSTKMGAKTLSPIQQMKRK